MSYDIKLGIEYHNYDLPNGHIVYELQQFNPEMYDDYIDALNALKRHAKKSVIKKYHHLVVAY